jgi:DeoR/GlpR family transcriptional regulator of sugar metabolism
VYPFQRKEKILNRLRNVGQIDINNDAKLFNVSISTLHRDLEDLEKQGLIKKVTGGAILGEGDRFESHFDKRLKTRVKQKKTIAKKAIERVQDDTSIFLDHSTTTLHIVGEIKQRRFKNLVVLTNALKVMEELGGTQGVQVISTGGIVEGEFKALSGRWVVESLERINLHQIFISVGAISLEHGFMTQIHFIHELILKLISRCQHINVLADSSKFFKIGTFQISPLKPSFTIFTDKELPEEIRAKIEKQGISLVI